MTRKTTALEDEIKSIIAEIVEVDPSKIGPDTELAKDLGVDSMMALEILAAIEKKFKIRIPDGCLPRMLTLSGAVEVARERLNVQ